MHAACIKCTCCLHRCTHAQAHRPTYGGQQALSEFHRSYAVFNQSFLTCDSAVSTSRVLPDLASPIAISARHRATPNPLAIWQDVRRRPRATGHIRHIFETANGQIVCQMCAMYGKGYSTVYCMTEVVVPTLRPLAETRDRFLPSRAFWGERWRPAERESGARVKERPICYLAV